MTQLHRDLYRLNEPKPVAVSTEEQLRLTREFIAANLDKPTETVVESKHE